VRVLVACFGNVLRGDDGVGVAVARRLLIGSVPDEVRVLDVGIGGIHLVQELLAPVDALVAVDAVDLGRPPGTVMVIDPEVADVRELGTQARRDALADMHYATPERAFLLARGLGVLPATTVLVGCQLSERGSVGHGLSPAVEAGVAPAADEVRRVVTDIGVPWT
jgi:hydrogenase maturation protease